MMRWLALFLVAESCLRTTAAAAQYSVQISMTESQRSCEDQKPINIGIIGAGAAGASTAYHLRRFATASRTPINITIFERSPYIGGRSTTVNAYDDPSQPVEQGASIFVAANRILRSAVDEFGLSTGGGFSSSDSTDTPGAALSIWDGEQFVFLQQGSSTGWWDVAKMLWKYGLAPLRTMRLMKATVAKFLTMYDAPTFPFTSLTQAAEEVGLLDVTAVTGEEFLARNGITGDFGRHVVQASTRVNYAQNLRYIHGLEAMVCMAAENAMSVEGGNWKIFESMVNASQATALLSTKVTSLQRQNDTSYYLTFDTTSEEDRRTAPKTQQFDAVVIAAPYQFADLRLYPTSQHQKPDQIPYVDLHVTLFTSPLLLSSSFFNLSTDEAVPRVILTTLPASENVHKGPEGAGSPGFFSISLLRAVTNPSTGKHEYLYKIFSPRPPTLDYLHSLLGFSTSTTPSSSSSSNDDKHNGEEERVSNSTITWLYRKLWQSYPYEYPRITFEEIQLAENLWYTSGIESFISTMETSALMGRNVAKLIIDQQINKKQLERMIWEMREESAAGRDWLAQVIDQNEACDAGRPGLD